MTFTSLSFFVFAGVFFLGWRVLRDRLQGRWIWLTFASFFFYGWWDWRFLSLLVATGVFDFVMGLSIERWPRYRRTLLTLSIVSNLSVLASFKYAIFVAGNLEGMLGWFGSRPDLVNQLPSALLILPIGISFYTFESLSYTIDVYKGHIRPTRNIFHFFAFLSMFPRLVAGPIERPANLLPQLEVRRPVSDEMAWKGFFLIVTGFFKKVVIADRLAIFVNETFAHAAPVSGVTWGCAMFAFALQIYCDFSGYSDIARGLANFMGFEFKLNFNAPYIARGFSDFWTRWHISLSSWFRDYLYIPLGGSRGGEWRAHRNLWITMLTSGLWHGAAWTYVVWGGFHALMLSVERLFPWPSKIGRWPAIAVTFGLGTLGWVFFRAPDFGKALEVLRAMLLFTPGAELVRPSIFVYLLLGLAPQWAQEISRRDYIECLPPQVWVRVALAILILACIYGRGPEATFIYFQF